MSAIDPVMARIVPFRPIRLIPLLSLSAFLVSAVWTADSGRAQSPDNELEKGLVRVNATTESLATGDALEINRRLLDDYNPKIIVTVPTTGLVLDRSNYVMAFLGYSRHYIPGPDMKYEIVTSDGTRYQGDLVGVDRGNGAAVFRLPVQMPAKPLLCTDCGISAGTVVIVPAKDPSGAWRYKEVRILSSRPNDVPYEEGTWILRMDWPLLGDQQPIFSRDRRVIGFLVSKDMSSVEKVMFPVSDLLVSAEKIIKAQRDIRAGWLGVYSEDYVSDSVSGVRIESITVGSPAEKAGLAASDVVFKYNGRNLGDVRQFIHLVQETPLESDVELNVLRHGEPITLKARIQARKPMDLLASAPPGLMNSFNPNIAGVFSGSAAGTHKFQIGLDTVDLNPSLASAWQIHRETGLLVLNISKQTPADIAGIKKGDVIVSVNGQPVTDAAKFAAYLKSLNSGSKVSFNVYRNGLVKTINVKLLDNNR
jgi:serine protease Do